MRLQITQARMTQQLTATMTKVYGSLQQNGGTNSSLASIEISNAIEF